MNKKGFTLIELVSVIIILGTILAIAIPNVLNIIDGSKERAFEASSNSIARKLESSSILKDYENKIINIVDGNFVEEDVKVTGDLPDSGTIFLNDRGQVAFTLFKENYCALKEFNGNVQVFEDINMCELVFSTITLIGDNPFYLRQNTIYESTVYVEPGFVAVDEFGNLATDRVTVTSDIDINTVGTYTVNYVLKNYSGDTIDTETRTVIVYDGIPPMVTTAVATSNNTTNNKYAINGNTVTLNLTFTKSVTDPTVTIGGRTATVTGSGNTRVATYTIPAGEAALTEGPLSVNVSNYYDIWNNLGLEQTNVTSGGLVTYDRTAPAVPTIAYTNGYITVTTQSVTFSSSDTISGILNYTVYRRSATMTGGTCGTYGAWSSLGTQTSPYTSTVVSGNCYQYYVLARNNAGLTRSSSTSPAVTTRVDTSAPSVPTLTVSETWTSAASVAGTIDGSVDAQSGILRYEYSMSGATTLGWTTGTAFAVTNAGQTTVTVRAINGAGTASATTSKVVRIDRTAPTSVAIAYTNGYITGTTQSVTFSATDAESGMASYTLYRRSATMTNGTCGAYGAWTSLGTQTSPYTSTVTSGNCYQYYVTATNNVGLSTSSTTSPTSVTRVDTSVPVCGTWTPSISPWKASGTQSFTLASSTDTQSGISTAGGSCVTGATNGSTCSVLISNNAGLTTSCTSPINRVDTTPPAVTTHNPTSRAWANANVSVTIGGGADAQSGFGYYQYCSTTTGATCTPSTSGGTATFTATGQYTLCSRAVDAVGNIGSRTCSVANAYKIDKTAPTSVAIAYTNGYITGTTQSVTFSATDAESGMASYTLYRRSATMTNGTCGAYGAWGSLGTQTSPYTSTVTSGNCYQYYVTATNNVGLSTSSTKSPASVTKVDTSVPVCGTWTPSISPWKASGTQSFTLASSTDTQSGISTAGGSCVTGATNGSTCSVLISNNAGLTRSCTSPINRVDTTAPAVTTHNPTSRAWANADVSVAIGGGADAESGFLRREYCYTTNGTTCTPSTIGNSVTFTATGQYTLCSRAVDAVGNIGSTTCSAANAYKIDKTAPTTPTVSYTNGYVTSTTQSVTFSSTDGESGVSSYTLYRRSATMTGGTCGTYGTWANLGTQTSPYTSTVASGNCYQYYVKATNGVSLSASSSTSPASVTKVDTSAPGTTTVSYTNGYITSTTQSVTFSSTGDSQSGISSYTVYRRSAAMTGGTCGTYGAWTSLGTQTSPYTSTVTSGNCYQYYVLTKNGAGLTSSSTTSPTAVTKVDTSAPSAPTITASGTEISKTVTLSGSSDTQSGILRYEYSLSGATTLGWTSGSSFTITNPGITLVSARAVNNAGLTSTTSTQNVSNDATAPTITYTNTSTSSSWYSTLPATTIRVQDTASGMKTLRYAWTTTTANPTGITSTTCTGGTAITVSGTAAITNATATGKPTTTGSSYYLHVCAVDVANNVRKSYSRYYLDATNPTCGTWTPSVSPWKSSGGQAFTLASSKDTGSGINVAGGSCTTGTSNGNTCTVGISDNSGRTATCTSPPNRVDTTAPTPTIAYTNGYITGTTQSVTFSATDAESGMASYTLYRRSATMTNGTCGAYGAWGSLGTQTSPYTSTVTSGNCYQYYVTATNNVGLSTSSTKSPTSVTRVDTSVPTCGTWTPSISPWKASGTQSFTLASSTDTQSGISTAGGSCVTGATNGSTCSVLISNNAGLTRSCTSPINRVETTAPTITYTNTSTSSSWYSTLPATTIRVQDTASGMKTLRYAWTTSTANPTGITSTTCTGGTAITVSGTAAITNATATGKPTTTGSSYYLHVCAVDVANNVRKSYSRYYLDATNPTCGTWTPSVSPWKSSGGQAFTLASSTDTGSGINVAGGSCTTGTSNGNTCTVGISDNVGRTATCTSPPNRVDTTAPTITYTNTSTSSSWYRTLPATTITVKDTASGMKTLRYAWTTSTANPAGITSTTCTGGTAITVSGTAAITNATATGKPTTTGSSYYLHVCAVDVANNVRKSYSRYYLDATNPTCGTWTPSVSPWKASGGQTFTLASSKDTGSGINVAGGSCTTGTSNGNTCTVGISDNSGRTATCTSPPNRVDTTAPTITYTNTSTSSSWYSTLPATTIRVQDTASGMKTLRYAWTTTTANPTGITSTTCTGGTAITVSGTAAITNATATGKPTTTGSSYYLHVCAVDVANNVRKSYSRYYLDATNPTCGTWTPSVSPWKSSGGQAFTLASSTDTGSGISTAGGSCVTGATNGSTCSVLISDNVGRTATCTSPPNRVDTTAPTITYTNTSTSSSWYRTLPATTIRVQDTASGMAKLRYAWTTTTANPAGITSTTCTGGTAITVSGTAAITNATATGKPTTTGSSYYLHVCAVDVANNVRKSYSRYYLDATNPTCGTWTPSVSPWKASGGQTFTLASSTDTGSGISTAGGSCTTGTSNGNTCTVGISDNVGRTATCTSPPNRVDTTAPSVPTLTVSEAWTKAASVSGTISGSTDAQSGILRYEYSMSGATTLGWTSGSSFSVTNAGQTTVTVRAINGAGKASTTTAKIVKIDRTAPTCTVAKTNTGTTSGVTITITRTDSGGSAVTVPGPYTNVKATATYSLSDAVGNTRNCTGNATVTKVKQYQSNTCTLYCASNACTCATWNTCQACGCVTWGNYTNVIKNVLSCSASGTQGLTEVYVTCKGITRYRYRGYDEEVAVYSAYVYITSTNAISACSGSPNYLKNCSSQSQAQFERRTYTGTCTAYCASNACTCATYNRCLACGCQTWGGWTGWSTTACTAAANQVQCNTRDIYN